MKPIFPYKFQVYFPASKQLNSGIKNRIPLSTSETIFSGIGGTQIRYAKTNPRTARDARKWTSGSHPSRRRGVRSFWSSGTDKGKRTVRERSGGEEVRREQGISIYKYKPSSQFQLLSGSLLLDANSNCESSLHASLFSPHSPPLSRLDSVIIFRTASRFPFPPANYDRRIHVCCNPSPPIASMFRTLFLIPPSTLPEAKGLPREALKYAKSSGVSITNDELPRSFLRMLIGCWERGGWTVFGLVSGVRLFRACVASFLENRRSYARWGSNWFSQSKL